MDELEKAIEEAIYKIQPTIVEMVSNGCSKEVIREYCAQEYAQAVREYLEKEGWVKPQCEHDYYVDKDGFCICRKGCEE